MAILPHIDRYWSSEPRANDNVDILTFTENPYYALSDSVVFEVVTWFDEGVSLQTIADGLDSNAIGLWTDDEWTICRNIVYRRMWQNDITVDWLHPVVEVVTTCGFWTSAHENAPFPMNRTTMRLVKYGCLCRTRTDHVPREW